jgi:hypothetical protein
VTSIGSVSSVGVIMRLPIILALLVIITLPKDVHGLMDDMSRQLTVAQVTIGKMLKRDDSIKVAEAQVITKSQAHTTKGVSANLR